MSREITHMFCVGAYDPSIMLANEKLEAQKRKEAESELIKQTSFKMPRTKNVDLQKFDDCIQDALMFLKDRKKEREKRKEIIIKNRERAIQALKEDKLKQQKKAQAQPGFKMKKFDTVGELIDTMNTALNRVTR